MDTLYDVTDPMCAWCWGFAPVLAEVRAGLAEHVEYRRVLGGLAPDSEEPMPAETREYVRSAWDAVERATGARFNRDFWTRCAPRRSTWPACRAVLAADAVAADSVKADSVKAGQEAARGGMGPGDRMFQAIQEAYYTAARNPSDRGTLVELAGEIGLDRVAFERVLDSPENHARLREDFALRDRLGVSGFPTLCFEGAEGRSVIVRGYGALPGVLAALDRLGALRAPA